MKEGTAAQGDKKFGILLAVVYFSALVLLIIFAVRIGASHYLALASEHGDADLNIAKSLYFEPNNPEAYIKRGEKALVNQDFPVAAESFQRAAELRRNDFVLWLRLGFALANMGERQGAVTAYRNSLALAPNYAQPNRLMGLLLLETREDEKAFEYLRKASDADGSYYPEVMDLAHKTYKSDPEAIERAVSPQNLTQRKALARFLIHHGLMTVKTRELLRGDEIGDQEKDEYINQLLSRSMTRPAYETWVTKSVIADAMRSNVDMIFDGGFEMNSSSDNVGFGWRLHQELAGTTVSVDATRSHAGARSLKVQFNGNVETGIGIVSQLVPVRPNKTYRLTFAARSEELTSGVLPMVTITAGHEPRASSPMIEATGGDWKIINVDFRTREEDAVLIELKRANCGSNPCPIFGSLWLDDLSLSELP